MTNLRGAARQSQHEYNKEYDKTYDEVYAAGLQGQLAWLAWSRSLEPDKAAKGSGISAKRLLRSLSIRRTSYRECLARGAL